MGVWSHLCDELPKLNTTDVGARALLEWNTWRGCRTREGIGGMQVDGDGAG
jgi:hypothetical protein